MCLVSQVSLHPLQMSTVGSQKEITHDLSRTFGAANWSHEVSPGSLFG